MRPPKQSTRGVKRKRSNDKDSEELDKEAKLRRTLYHALRDLRKAVKKARIFEVQRTLKKLKEARREDPQSDVTKDLEAQMKMFKHLDYDQFAKSALVTKIKKDRTLSANVTIQSVSVELASNLVSPEAPGTPTAKAQSRILSSKILASKVMSIMETLNTFLHPPVEVEGIEKATNNSYILKKRRTETCQEKTAFLIKGSATDPAGGRVDEEYENASGDEAVGEADDSWQSGTVQASSESDDSVAGVADDHDASSEDSSEADFPPEDRKCPIFRTAGRSGQSKFFPSLSVGFTRGDSGSEFSDSEAKIVDGIKKNRRGQRARRAIWEKKFGKNANHVKKKQLDTERHQPGSFSADRRSGKRNTSPGPRRTPVQLGVPTHGHEQLRRPFMTNSEGAKNLGSAGALLEHTRRKRDLLEKGRPKEPPLHPSWEAKRKQKSAGIEPSQGTKIVF